MPLANLATRAFGVRRPGAALVLIFQGGLDWTFWLFESGARSPHSKPGTGGEIRTLEASLEDSHVSSYITPAKEFRIADFEFADFV